MIELYCDGACSGNPGPGGWAFVIKERDNPNIIYEESGYSKFETTNNKMEIQACIEGLHHIYAEDLAHHEIQIVTDSQYVINTMTKGWARNKNTDYWTSLDEILAKIQANNGVKISWRWVKGHASNPYNAKCDKLAVEAYKNKKGYMSTKSGMECDVEIMLKFSHLEQEVIGENYLDIFEYITRDFRKFYVAISNCKHIVAMGDSKTDVKLKAQGYLLNQ